MKNKKILSGLVIIICCLFCGILGCAQADKPNIVFILVDDLGWRDLSCYGAEVYETPNIDRIASEGMRFTDAYAACNVCSPTRASVMTGKYPARLQITNWIPGHKPKNAKLVGPPILQELPHSETTIAEVLGDNGYVSASIGKWHLGGEMFYPDKHGFDLNVAGTHKGQPPSYFSPYRISTLADGPEGEYLTDRMGREAVRFIEENRKKPFFLYLPFFTVHTPIQSKPELIEKYQQKDRNINPAYAGMVESLDQAVGNVLMALERLNLDDNTIVVFTSDNGGLSWFTDNAPLRGGKGSAYEGGVRVPLIFRWPGFINKSAESNIPVCSIDLYPTILDLIGIEIPNQVDGVSVKSLLGGVSDIKRNMLFWHFPHYHPGGATPYSAIRKDHYRLVEFFEDNRVELYDLKNDISETEDISSHQPELTKELKKALADWREEVTAKYPRLNPDYDPKLE